MARRDSRTGITLLLIFGLLAAGVVATGAYYYRSYEENFRAGAEERLAGIADLKVRELVQYRRVRLAEGNILARNAAISALVRRVLEKPDDTEAQNQLQVWFGKFLGLTDYDVIRLLDAHGVTRLSSPTGLPPVAAVVLQRIPEILRVGQVTFQDFHRNEHDQRIYLDVLVPIFDGPDDRLPLGVIYLRLNPASYLFPFISRWPTPSPTAETLLVRRDGNDVLFLNDLKFQKNTALSLRFPLTRTEITAVKAVLGQTGLVDGIDYRGMPVLAVLRAIPDAPWFLVARMDTAEVYEPIRERLWEVVGVIGLLLFGSGAGLGLLWRQQHLKFFRQRYEAEVALRESEERYRLVVENLGEGVALVDAGERFTYANPATEDIFGVLRGSLQGRNLLEFVAPEQCGLIHGQTLKRAAGERSVYEHQIRRPDGEIRHVRVSAVPQFDRQGGFVGTFGVFQDITERERSVEALRLSEEKFRTMADFTYDWEYWIGPDLRFIYVSPACERVTGYRAEEFLRDSKLFEAIVHSEDRPMLSHHLADSASCDLEPQQLEFRIVTRSGEERWIAHTCQPVQSERGVYLGRRASNRDITLRKRAVLALQDSLHEKEALLKEVHHRVKNNLQVITSLLRLQAAQIEHPITQAVLKDMQGRIRSMALLHETLYRSGNFARVDLGGYLRDLCGHLLRSIGTPGGAVALQVEAAPASVELDQAISCGLLVNELASNSLKHAFPAGRPGTVRVELHALEGGTQLRLRVTDDGVGLPADFAQKQAHTLGMQLVQDLAGQLGGKLAIGPGPGTTFELIFPLTKTTS